MGTSAPVEKEVQIPIKQPEKEPQTTPVEPAREPMTIPSNY